MILNINIIESLYSTHKPPIPKVSIGMPVYNGEKYIQEALDSLLAQTFTDFELIISDNASTDATDKICREYTERDNRIRYVRQKQNLGANSNFQFVFDQAVGEYFMWAAADDVWGKYFIERNVLVLHEKPECIASISKCSIDGNENPVLCGYAPIEHENIRDRIYTYIRKPAANARFYSLYRLCAIKKIKISEFDYLGGDWGFIVEVLKCGKFCVSKGDEVSFFKRGKYGASSNIVSLYETYRRKRIELLFPFYELSIYLTKSNPPLPSVYRIIIRLNFVCFVVYWINKIKKILFLNKS